MKCEDAQTLLHAWLDQELDPANAAAFSQHLSQCATCKEKAEEFAALSKAIKTGATRYTPSPELYNRIAGATVGKKALSPLSAAGPFKWGGFGAVLSMAACLALFLFVRPDEQYVLQQQLLTSHIRSLQEGHLMDVASTDQHTVKPWFNGRLDISPPVVDLVGDGFPLVGGRLDYIDDHAAAVLVYGFNKHIINLFIWHAAETRVDLGNLIAQQGYNMRHWQKGDLQFWAISDVNAAKLAEFEQIYSARTR
jgi:anti-sigma factor RsiW